MPRQKNKGKVTPLYLNEKFASWLARSMTSYINVMEGAIRTGKDYTAIRAFIERIRDFDGVANIFAIAAVSIKNCYRIIGTLILDYCGEDAQPSRDPVSGAPAITLKTKNGDRSIIFIGGENKGSEEEIRGLTLGGVFFTEINNLDLDFVEQAIKRTSADGRKAFIFATLNPKGAKHPFYKLLDQWLAEGSSYCNYLHVKLEDSPALGKEQIELLKKGKDPNSVSYKRDILGERVDAEGLIFHVSDSNIIHSYDPLEYSDFITVLDPGITTSASAIICAAYNYRNRSLDIIREFKWKNTPGQIAMKHSKEISDEYIKFTKECQEIFRRYPSVCIIDGFPRPRCI